jgi:hypothetical protein
MVFVLRVWMNRMSRSDAHLPEVAAQARAEPVQLRAALAQARGRGLGQQAAARAVQAQTAVRTVAAAVRSSRLTKSHRLE